MTKDEALKLALEALEKDVRFYKTQKLAAITAIKQAIAEPVQSAERVEPVACVIDGDLYFHHEIDWEDLAYQRHGVELLYATPPAAQPAPLQPVAWIERITGRLALPTDEHRMKFPMVYDPLYTTPPAAQPAPVQEPVAWMDGYRNIYSLEEKAAGCEDAVIPLVPAIQHWSDCAVHNEPAYPKGDCDCGGYSAPPNVATPQAAQRQWVGLTDEQIQEVAFTAVSDNWDWLRFARAIEAKLKEKNT